MQQAPIDELLQRCHSVYKLVVVAARRAKELAEGAPKLVETDLKKVTSVALEEIRQGKVRYKPAEGEEAAEAKPKRTGRARATVAAASKRKKS
ncbi:MAG: DNA-directed RNA polymerase subunit omega [Candidatus Omnitrophica bacterium]|nr:DNA-directed RNA polymerase subunit omega [Candidatus Omnitrophota bacterium]